MKDFAHLRQEILESITTDREWTKKGYGSFGGQGTEFVWAAFKGGKLYKTGKIGGVTLADAGENARKIAGYMDGVDSVKIMGRQGKVLKTINTKQVAEISGTEPAMDLGSLTSPAGSGKARKAKVKKDAGAIVQEMIRKEGGAFVVRSQDGKKVLGRYKTEAEAKKRLKQVEFFKKQHTEEE